MTNKKAEIKVAGMVCAMCVGALEIALKKPDDDFRRREMPWPSLETASTTLRP